MRLSCHMEAVKKVRAPFMLIIVPTYKVQGVLRLLNAWFLPMVHAVRCIYPKCGVAVFLRVFFCFVFSGVNFCTFLLDHHELRISRYRHLGPKASNLTTSGGLGGMGAFRLYICFHRCASPPIHHSRPCYTFLLHFCPFRGDGSRV